MIGEFLFVHSVYTVVVIHRSHAKWSTKHSTNTLRSMLLLHHLFDYVMDIASTLISESTTRTTFEKYVVCTVIYLMYILILAPTLPSAYCSIIISLKFASHLCIHLFLDTPQFLFSLRDTSSVSSDLCQN